MADLQRLTDDHSREPVPVEESVSGWRVAMVIIGFAITLPLMITGSQVGLAMGLSNALTAFAVGGLVLTVIGSATAVVATSARLSTYKILEFAFGCLGAKIVSAVLALTLFGWYGVTAELFGQALSGAAADIYSFDLPIMLGTVVGSVLMVVVTVFGFKALDRLSLLAVPLLVLFLSGVVVRSLGNGAAALSAGTGELTLGVAISVVVGTYIVGAVLVPDLCRYARSTGHGVLAIVLSLGVGLPCILAAAAVPSLATQEADLVRIMLGLGLGLPALCVIVFATWTSNANNLYSMSLGLATIFDGIDKWRLTVAAGVAGTLVAMAGVTEIFIPFLLTLGIGIPPVAGVYLADYFAVKGVCAYSEPVNPSERAVNPTAFISWLVATAVGAITARELFSVTQIPACDSFLTAVVVYYVSHRLFRRGTATRRLRQMTRKSLLQGRD